MLQTISLKALAYR